MGLRFHRSIRILPGVRLNVSKSGVSWSIGRAGATLNIRKDGVTRTIGIPGTGISDRSRIALPEASTAPVPTSSSSAQILVLSVILLLLVLAVAAMIYGSWTDPMGRTTIGQFAKVMVGVFSRVGGKR